MFEFSVAGLRASPSGLVFGACFLMFGGGPPRSPPSISLAFCFRFSLSSSEIFCLSKTSDAGRALDASWFCCSCCCHRSANLCCWFCLSGLGFALFAACLSFSVCMFSVIFFSFSLVWDLRVQVFWVVP